MSPHSVTRGLSGRCVLVTGASGFIGSNLVTRLAESDAEVFATARTVPEQHGAQEGIWYPGDLSDPGFAESLLDDVSPEIIFHLAACVTGSRDLNQVIPTLEGNLLASVNLLLAATRLGLPRVVLAGSLEEPEGGEISPVPCSPYAASKWATSGYARMFSERYSLPVVTARIFMAYGPGQREIEKLVPYAISALLAGETPKFSSGSRLVDWVYIDDVVDGLIRTASIEPPGFHTVDIGTGTLTSVRDVVESIAQAMGSHTRLGFGELPDRSMERVRRADVEVTESKLAWHPRMSLTEGIPRTVRWYTDNLPNLQRASEV